MARRVSQQSPGPSVETSSSLRALSTDLSRLARRIRLSLAHGRIWCVRATRVVCVRAMQSAECRRRVCLFGAGACGTWASTLRSDTRTKGRDWHFLGRRQAAGACRLSAESTRQNSGSKWRASVCSVEAETSMHGEGASACASDDWRDLACARGRRGERAACRHLSGGVFRS